MQKAVVVLSGGQDSTTCLYWARARYDVHAVTFDYGQRHAIEITAAAQIAALADVPHEIIRIGDVLKGTSPLVDSKAVLEQYTGHDALPGGLEKTFVPMRNQLFLTIAANRAYVLGTNIIITGVSAEDYGGYPDCRPAFIEALVIASSLGTFTKDGLRILTPVMNRNKRETVEMALDLDGCYEALALSHTAYDGVYPPIGKDHASLLRAKGFEEAGVPDPLVLRAWIEDLLDLPLTANYSNHIIAEYHKQVNRVMTWLRLHEQGGL